MNVKTFVIFAFVLAIVLHAQNSENITGELRDFNTKVRLAAVKKLWQAGTATTTELPTLIKLLSDPHEDVRFYAAQIIQQMEDKAVSALPFLIKSLADQPKIQQIAAQAIANLNEKAVDSLIIALSHSNETIQIQVVEIIGKIGMPSVKHAIPKLIGLLGGYKNEEVKMSAVNTLTGFGKVVVPSLIEALNNRHSRHYAVEILGKIGPEAEGAIPHLVKILGEVRSVPKALKNIGKASIPPLLELLAKSDEKSCRAVIDTLDLIDANWRNLPEIPRLVADLIANLRDPEITEKDVYTTAMVLENLGSLAHSAIGDLIETMSKPNLWSLAVRKCIESLKKIDPNWMNSPIAQEKYPVLLKALSNLEPLEHGMLLKALQKIESMPEELVAYFITMLASVEYSDKEAAVFTLAKIAPKNKDIIPHLVAMLNDSDWSLRETVVDVLSNMGEIVVPDLIYFLTTDSETMLENLLNVLKNLGPKAKIAVPHLIRLAKSTPKSDHLTQILKTLDKIDNNWKSQAEK